MDKIYQIIEMNKQCIMIQCNKVGNKMTSKKL